MYHRTDKIKKLEFKLKKVFLGFFFLVSFHIQSNMVFVPVSVLSNTFDYNLYRVYSSLNLHDLNFEAFYNAYRGMKILNDAQVSNNDSILTIVDFTKPSSEERLYVIDILNKKLLFHTLVAHGKNSGDVYAESFSNVINSHQSSLGLYLTGDVYYGKHGYSLILNGMEQGTNDNAKDRAIVIHGANYVSKKYIEQYGRLGRSFGCPAIPNNITRKLIDLIKNGSCLYLYHPSSSAEMNLALH